ncbi:cyanamide hydratase [Fusarium mundagurra]|uniref:Cyanamide hydratase n=1 Tax=Fusarium mundagurra TaxID=1567541 RepID=A0A8H5XYG8_9HYPO|nr:cyanamide hydratase [Fusarium mundagurra]
MSTKELAQNGWTAVPVDAGKIFQNGPSINEPDYVNVNSIEFLSNDPIVTSVILRQQFLEHANTLTPSTLALACLLHDIGTTEENITSTRLSFEFQGGIQALDLLNSYGSTKDQAEAVCETVIRHQDFGTEGNITFLGQLIQLATIYDNVGDHPAVKDFGLVIHKRTREEVNQAFLREGWLKCFAATIRKEEQLKPWCHTTRIPNCADHIEGNLLMQPYE